MEPRQRIINEILAERTEQTNRYTNTHDDSHTRTNTWNSLILAYLKDLTHVSHKVMRKRFIQIAAICIAIVESYDRLYGTNEQNH